MSTCGNFTLSFRGGIAVRLLSIHACVLADKAMSADIKMDAEIKMDDEIKMDLSEEKQVGTLPAFLLGSDWCVWTAHHRAQDTKDSATAALSLDDGPAADVIQLVSQVCLGVCRIWRYDGTGGREILCASQSRHAERTDSHHGGRRYVQSPAGSDARSFFSPDKDAKEFPLPNVKAAVLRKVIDYLTHHVDAPAPEVGKMSISYSADADVTFNGTD